MNSVLRRPLMDKPQCIATPPAGHLAGTSEGGVCIFRGIPYARAARFQAPEPCPTWDGVREATRPGPMCPQAPDPLAFFIGSPKLQLEPSEDCQVLTIATPALTGQRPVMVWIHGGGYLCGSGELACYSPQRLAAEGDVVVVSISYRLGAFGFLAVDGGQANCGTLDQLAALQWVQRNIHAFGGDPARVTVFGQSAGGHSVFMLLCAPAAQPLFQRAIIQSAPLGVRQSAHDQAQVAIRFRAALKQDPYRASAQALLAAQVAVTPQAGTPLPFSPAFSSAPPTAMRSIDVMLGWTRDDAAPFVGLARNKLIPLPFALPLLGDGLVARLLTRQLFAVPALAFAQTRSGQHAGPQKTYLYRLDTRFANNRYGAGHCIDLPLLLGDEASWQGAPLLGGSAWPAVHASGHSLRAAWAAFARAGNPNAAGGYRFKPFSRFDPSPVQLNTSPT